ncbi:MAG: helix-turn-helix domain-containing protein [Candidatus Angelobacter sp.]
MSTEIAKVIKTRLKEMEKNQAWLAEKAGVSVVAVSKWTTTGKISRDNVPAVAEALGLTTDQLLRAEGAAPFAPEKTWLERLTMDEKEMLELYRRCTFEGQLMLKGAARVAPQASPSKD